MTATKKLRWKIAHLMDRLPGQCWADLVSWVVDGRRIRNERGALPWRPVTETCLQPGDERCYCGKLPLPPVNDQAAADRAEAGDGSS